MRLGKHSMIIIIGSLILITLLISAWIGHSKTSPQHLVNQFTTAVKNNDAAQLRPLLVSGSKNKVVTKSSAQALLTYLHTHKDDYQGVKSSLTKQAKDKNPQSSSALNIVQTGRAFIYKAYKIKLHPQTITVSGLREGEVLAINADERGIKRKKSHFGPILPGTYVIQKQLTNELGIFIKKEKIAVWDQPISINIDSAEWMKTNNALQKQIFERINQFNKEVSDWETSEYNPAKLPSTTKTFGQSQSAIKIVQFTKLKTKIDEIQSAYRGMIVDPDSLILTHFGDHWNVSVDTVVSYIYAYKLKSDKQMKDASYQRGISFRLIYDSEQKRWLVSGISDNFINAQTASGWEHKKEVIIPDPIKHVWPAEKEPNL